MAGLDHQESAIEDLSIGQSSRLVQLHTGREQIGRTRWNHGSCLAISGMARCLSTFGGNPVLFAVQGKSFSPELIEPYVRQPLRKAGILLHMGNCRRRGRHARVSP
jgi:hypothetical protein